jgi:SAM-dependent methyltransferase
MKLVRQLVLLSSFLALAVAPRTSQHRPLRAPDVPFQPSPREVVVQMLKLAGVRNDDILYDLGCGDGRVLIAAAQLYGARGVGIDIDPQRIKESRANAWIGGVLDRVTFRNEDLFESDIAEATVVTLFLWPKVNLRLRPKLWRELRPGTRVVSYFWDMGDWVPAKRVEVNGTPIYLWRIPGELPHAVSR